MARTKVSNIPQPTSEAFEKVLQLLKIPPASTDSMRRWLPVVLWKMTHEWLNQCDEKEGRKAPEIPTFPSDVAAIPIKRTGVSVPIFVSLSPSLESSLDKSQPPSSPSKLEQADLDLLQSAMVGSKMAVEDVGNGERVSQEQDQIDIKAAQASERGKRYEARTKMSAEPVAKAKRGKRSGTQTPEVSVEEEATKSTVDAGVQATSLQRSVAVQTDLELFPPFHIPTREIEPDENTSNDTHRRPSSSRAILPTAGAGQHNESRISSRSPSQPTTVEAFLSGFPLKVAENSPSSELSDLSESQQGQESNFNTSKDVLNDDEQSLETPRKKNLRKRGPVRRSTESRPRISTPSPKSSRPSSESIPPRQQLEQEVSHRVTRTQKIDPSSSSSSAPPLRQQKRRKLDPRPSSFSQGENAQFEQAYSKSQSSTTSLDKYST
ncbi:hypothetical protein JCM5350_001114 [Sporobolomyces pararoseus]